MFAHWFFCECFLWFWGFFPLAIEEEKSGFTSKYYSAKEGEIHSHRETYCEVKQFHRTNSSSW